MSNNGLVLRQGSKADFRGAWIMRLFQAALATITAAAVIWFGKVIYAGVMYLVVTVPPLQASMNKMNDRLAALETSSGEYVKQKDLKRELSEAEMRVRNDFTKQLNEQLKRKGRVVTPD